MLHRLEEAAAKRPVMQPAGFVDAIGSGMLRVGGLQSHVDIGDRVVCQGTGRPVTVEAEVIRIDPDRVTVAPFTETLGIRRGDLVLRRDGASGQPSRNWLGRILNALGQPIDGRGPLADAPAMAADGGQAPVRAADRAAMAPFETGVRAIDIFTPLCFGQRFGIFAGSGVGKSTLLGMMARAEAFDSVVVGLIGERSREAREFIEQTLDPEVAKKTALIVATSDESAMMRRNAADLAMATAERLRGEGDRVLLLLDSVTRYAQALREIGIALREPPVARGYPPSVFATLPRMLERAGIDASGRGSITMISTVLVDGDDHNEPVADAVRGILDGHLVLDRSIAAEGRYPPVDLTQSISRLSDRAWSEEQTLFVRELRSLVARYEETRDLRMLGGWKRGADRVLDQAVDLVPVIYDGLRQSPGEAISHDPFGDLARRMKTAQAGG